MDENAQRKPWSNVQAYSLAVICLFLGMAIGYLLHAPTRPVAAVRTAPAIPQMNGAAPTPEQLKHMGDKMAEPILAALRKDPNDARLLERVAGVYYRAQQFPAAVEYYERAVKISPSAKLLVSLSNSYHYAGADDRAIETLNRALEVDPKSTDALFNLGMLKWRAENDPKAAIDAWEQILKIDPGHPRRAYLESMIARAKQHQNMPAGVKTNKPAM